jgi:hypothetical protein
MSVWQFVQAAAGLAERAGLPGFPIFFQEVET